MNQTGVLVIAHAPLASALKAVAEHVYPDCADRLAVLDVPPGMSPDALETQARQRMNEKTVTDWLVLTDVFGATPCNVAQRLGDGNRGAKVRVLAGVSVPMLWRALCYAQEPVDEVAERALAGATQGAMPVAVRPPQQQGAGQLDRSGSLHDQDRRHDQ